MVVSCQPVKWSGSLTTWRREQVGSYVHEQQPQQLQLQLQCGLVLSIHINAWLIRPDGPVGTNVIIKQRQSTAIAGPGTCSGAALNLVQSVQCVRKKNAKPLEVKVRVFTPTRLYVRPNAPVQTDRRPQVQHVSQVEQTAQAVTQAFPRTVTPQNVRPMYAIVQAVLPPQVQHVRQAELKCVQAATKAFLRIPIPQNAKKIHARAMTVLQQ
jgi:hypothetical protein